MSKEKGLPFRPVQMSPFCGATGKTTGKPCRKPAGHNTGHPGIGRCGMHGGATPTHYAAAAIAQARQSAQLFAAPRTVNPLDGLLEEYHRTAGMVDAYEAMCAQLMPDEVVWGRISVEESGSTQEEADGDADASLTPGERTTKSGPGVNVWVKLLAEERDRFARLAVEILKLDLASRHIEYSQSQVAGVVTVLLSPELGLSEDQRRVAARLLRALGDDGRPKAIEGSVA